MKQEVVAELSHKNQKTLYVVYQCFTLKMSHFCKDLA